VAPGIGVAEFGLFNPVLVTAKVPPENNKRNEQKQAKIKKKFLKNLINTIPTFV